MAVRKPKTVIVGFDREKATKNKQRFSEQGDGPHVVGVLYVTKQADEALGSPDSLKVTLEPGE